MPPRKRRVKRSTEHARVRRLAHKDGTYERLLAAQGGGCSICGKPPKPTRRLHIDHDHRTMEIRGVLCFRCNTTLRVWITALWLRRAADYLDGLLPGGRNHAERKRLPDIDAQVTGSPST